MFNYATDCITGFKSQSTKRVQPSLAGFAKKHKQCITTVCCALKLNMLLTQQVNSARTSINNEVPDNSKLPLTASHLDTCIMLTEDDRTC